MFCQNFVICGSFSYMWFLSFFHFLLGITFTAVDCLWTLKQHWPPPAMLWAVQKVWWANFLMIYPQLVPSSLVSFDPAVLEQNGVHPSKSWAFRALCRCKNRPTRYSGDVRQLSDASGCRDFRGPRPPQRKLQTVRWWRKTNKCGFHELCRLFSSSAVDRGKKEAFSAVQQPPWKRFWNLDPDAHGQVNLCV